MFFVYTTIILICFGAPQKATFCAIRNYFANDLHIQRYRGGHEICKHKVRQTYICFRQAKSTKDNKSIVNIINGVAGYISASKALQVVIFNALLQKMSRWSDPSFR